MRKTCLCSDITSNIWLCLCEYHFSNERRQELSGLKNAKGQRMHVKLHVLQNRPHFTTLLTYVA